MTLSDRYQLILYDNTDTTLEGEIVNILSAVETEVFQGSRQLVIEVPVFDTFGVPEATYNSENTAPLPILDFIEKKYIRVIDLIEGITTRFIIQQVRTVRKSGDTRYVLECEPRRFIALEQLVLFSGTLAGINASQFLAGVVQRSSDFSAGTVDVPDSETRTVQIFQPTILEAVKVLVKAWSDDTTTYYFQISEAGVIDILLDTNFGIVHTEAIEFGKNLVSLERRANASGLANRIYGVGNDEVLTLAPSDSARFLDDSVGTSLTSAGGNETLTVVTAPGAATPNSIFFVEVECQSIVTGATDIDFNYKLEFMNDSSVVRATRTLTRQHAHTGSGTFTFTDRSSTFFSAGIVDVNKIKLTIVTVDDSNTTLTSFYVRFFKMGFQSNVAAPLAYVEDTTSQTAYGLREATVKINKPLLYNDHNDGKDVPAATFVGLSPTMSGTYASGVHEGWSASGGATLSENSDTSFIRNGAKSQKVVTTAAAQGAVLDVTSFTPGFPLYAPETGYSSEIWIYIESGSVEIKMEAEDSGDVLFTGTLTGVGWNFLRAENWRLKPPTGFSDIGQTPWESCGLQILSLDDAGGTFYIDSICHHRGNSFVEFVELSTAEELTSIAKAELAERKNPRLSFKVTMKDVSQAGDLEGALVGVNNIGTVGYTGSVSSSGSVFDDCIGTKLAANHYTATSANFVSRLYWFGAKGFSDRVVSLGVYTVTAGVPDVLVGGIHNIAVDDAAEQLWQTGILNIPLTDGLTYTVCFTVDDISDWSTKFHIVASGSSKDASTSLPATWSDDSNSSREYQCYGDVAQKTYIRAGDSVPIIDGELGIDETAEPLLVTQTERNYVRPDLLGLSLGDILRTSDEIIRKIGQLP